MRVIGQKGLARARRRLRLPTFITMVSSFCALVSCVYDSGDRCGPHQKFTSDGTCVCESGYTATETACVTCGVNEVMGAAGCVCAAGYGRSVATDPCAACGANAVTNASGACECATGYVNTGSGCEPLSAGLGVACSEATSPCTDVTYSVCHSTSGAQGYCTKAGCTSADCTGGYACDTSGATSYCRRPPLGAGTSCTSNADCASGEATYCDTYSSHVCMVQGCTLSPNSCFPGTECCDLSTYGVPQPLCVPQGACAT